MNGRKHPARLSLWMAVPAAMNRTSHCAMGSFFFAPDEGKDQPESSARKAKRTAPKSVECSPSRLVCFHRGLEAGPDCFFRLHEESPLFVQKKRAGKPESGEAGKKNDKPKEKQKIRCSFASIRGESISTFFQR